MAKKDIISSTRLSVALVAIVLSFTGAAHAGFEWRGAASSTPAAVASEAMPAPVIMWDGVVSEQAPASMPAEKVGQVTSMPVAPAPAMTATPIFNAPVMDTPASVDILSGFASDIPLAIALQQVVPPGHQFSFAAGSDPGASVSWQGGKPWKDVLAAMLDSKGLGYRITNNVVVIAPANSAPLMQHHIVANDLPNTSGVENVSSAVVWSDVPAAPAAETAPIDIRRKKPSTLLNKLKRMTQTEEAEAKVEHIAVPRQPELVVQPSAAAPAGMSMPMPISDDYMPMSVVKPVAATPVVPYQPSSPAAVTGGKMNEDQTAAPMLSAPTWHGAKGQTLRDVLDNWSEVAGVELYWSIDYDYRLEEDFARNGSYDEAVGGILDKFAAARPQPYGQLHQGGDSTRVLVVKSYDLIP